MAAPRNITPLLAKLRDALIGRKYKNHLRFEGTIVARTQDPPNLPEGVSHKLSDNYYLTRDGRREVAPPEVIYTASRQLLESGEEGKVPALSKPVTPGHTHNWDI
ncbi:NADH dehydrogenase [ubiquinone] 1 alpha subcomplex subunit 7-like isoform X2 [Littorina saxatilis]|uniref:NADH dehydrogenase [ubiquinone] 1 alpha subcomplex subunit 7 n=1 Tax=Littorina saxatilis TaxID=31220 RepID=A0AAN9GA09_9CAEN